MTLIDEINDSKMCLEEYMKVKEADVETKRKQLERAKKHLAEITARVDEFEKKNSRDGKKEVNNVFTKIVVIAIVGVGLLYMGILFFNLFG